jgi:hypothetical protein
MAGPDRAIAVPQFLEVADSSGLSEPDPMLLDGLSAYLYNKLRLKFPQTSPQLVSTMIDFGQRLISRCISYAPR